LTEIYLCSVCSCQEILGRNGRGQAELPEEWDVEEDGEWEPPLIDGGDGGGGFFRKISRAQPCGFPAPGLGVLRRLLVRLCGCFRACIGAPCAGNCAHGDSTAGLAGVGDVRCGGRRPAGAVVTAMGARACTRCSVRWQATPCWLRCGWRG
jgi:hypothetical protein